MYGFFGVSFTSADMRFKQVKQQSLMCIHAAAWYVLLFLALAVNSKSFIVYIVTCSYSTHLFYGLLLPPIATSMHH